MALLCNCINKRSYNFLINACGSGIRILLSSFHVLHVQF